MIRIQNLIFRYPDRDFCLSIPKLHVKKGERVALIGESGSGKTTLMHLIAGILMPEHGNIVIAQTPLHELNERERSQLRRREMGMIFQSLQLLDYLNLKENICIGPLIEGKMKESKHRLNRLSSALNIQDKLNQTPPALSQGERQRAAIARGIFHEPNLVLADEPTGNLDPDHSHCLMKLLTEELLPNQSSLFMVTHDHHLLKYFHRVIDIRELQKAS